MPKRPTLKPIHVPGRERPWKIELPASLSSTGQRARYFFESKQDAINFAEEHKIRLRSTEPRASPRSPRIADRNRLPMPLLR